MQDTVRTRRVAEMMKQAIAEIMIDGISNPDVKDVVITDVRVTKDLSIAKVYFTTYNKKELGTIKKAIERSNSFIYKNLCKRLYMKRVPKLEFYVDEVEMVATRIEELLKENI